MCLETPRVENHSVAKTDSYEATMVKLPKFYQPTTKNSYANTPALKNDHTVVKLLLVTFASPVSTKAVTERGGVPVNWLFCNCNVVKEVKPDNSVGMVPTKRLSDKSK
jgi:hypothetical protein